MKLSRTTGRALALAATVALAVPPTAPSAVAASTSAPAPAPAPGASHYYPSGPQLDVPVATVTDGGWTECYRDLYGDALGSAATAARTACTEDYLMLAARPTGSSKLSLLAAAPREDVLLDTGQDATTTNQANGSEWYYADSWSWGFAPAGDLVDKRECDVAPGPLRLCWHTSDGVGGFRIGDLMWLHHSVDHERIVYQSSGGAFADPGLSLTGPARVGTPVVAASGPSRAAAERTTYQWQVVAGATATDIAGADQSSYTPRPGQVGVHLRIVVTRTAPGYVPRTDTATTAAVRRGRLQREVVKAAGKARVGGTLSVKRVRPTDQPAGFALTYRWTVDGDPIDGRRAQKRTYELRRSLRGKKVAVVVTARAPGHATRSFASKPRTVR